MIEEGESRRDLAALVVPLVARAFELLGVSQGLVAPEEQTIGVVALDGRIERHALTG
jgi:hypothetical protein